MRRTYEGKSGDYVLCCKYADRDPQDGWQVGFLDRVEDGLFYLRKPLRRYFKVCYFITPNEGRRIVETSNPRSACINRYPVRPYVWEATDG